MRLPKPTSERKAARSGRKAILADRRAGGFANACDGTGHDMSAAEEAAFNRAYRRWAPRKWGL